ncbi:MAG: hypothetical protein QMD65_00985 [Patescibacteria group bacterium]|nr:hypothetical protein [Patescibacteria group bacterium]
MVKVINFHEKIEQDLAKLSLEIKEQRNRPDIQKLPEREIVKRSLKSFSANLGNEPVSAPPPPPAVKHDHVRLPAYLEKENVDSSVKYEIEKLIDMVFHEGLEKAVREAKNRSPFVEDSFHDALVDKLLPELKKTDVFK